MIFMDPEICRVGSLGLRMEPLCPIWEFPKIRGTILGVPILRIIVF